VSVSGSGISAAFVFDGDGNRVKATVSNVTTAFVGGYYEWTSNGNTAYYSAGGARVAMRRTGYASDNGLFWILGDHLGSTSVTATSTGSLKAKMLYKAWGYILSIGKKPKRRENRAGQLESLNEKSYWGGMPILAPS